jgi:hypothetical protein
MLIRRIREHVAAHDWFAVAVDLAIVIAGVFLGLQVSNWNQARIDADRAREYRARLLDELEVNRLQYRQQLAYYQKVRSHSLAALNRLRDPDSRRGLELLVDTYQATQLDIWPAKRFIYDEMVAAGMVGSIGNPRAQQLASDFYLGVDAIGIALSKEPAYRHLVRRAMPYAVQRQIRAQCGDRLVAVEGRVVGIAMPDECRPDISAEAIAEGVSQVGRQPELQRELTGHLAALDQKIGLLSLTIRQAEEALAGLRVD